MKLRILKKRILRLERELISEHARTKDYCDSCKQNGCSHYTKHMVRKSGLLDNLSRLKRIIASAKSNNS